MTSTQLKELPLLIGSHKPTHVIYATRLNLNVFFYICTLATPGRCTIFTVLCAGTRINKWMGLRTAQCKYASSILMVTIFQERPSPDVALASCALRKRGSVMTFYGGLKIDHVGAEGCLTHGHEEESQTHVTMLELEYEPFPLTWLMWPNPERGSYHLFTQIY